MRVLLVIYDNDSHISFFPMGLAYIATVMRKLGHTVEIYSQDVYHNPDHELTTYLDQEVFDVVGISLTGGYYQYRKLKTLSAAINNSRNRPFFLIGGHGPSADPSFFLKKSQADMVIMGEGELTIVEVMERLELKQNLAGILGTALRQGNDVQVNPRRPLIQNIDTIDLPAYDLFPIDHYSLLRLPNIGQTERGISILSGRGCTFTCNFCYRLDTGFRARSPQSILEEIRYLQKRYRIQYISFLDELLMSSVERTLEICDAILAAGMKFSWSCNGRLNYAKKHVLDQMRKAGCTFINYGIESLDPKALITMKKGLTVKQIHEGIQNTLAADISPGFNIIWGNIGETRESLRLGVEFLLQYDDHAQFRTIRPVTPYPGSPLYDYAIEKGLLKDCEDFYEHKHTNSDLLAVNFTDMTDQEFHAALFEANSQLMVAYYESQKKYAIEKSRKLYFQHDAGFRGFRQT